MTDQDFKQWAFDNGYSLDMSAGRYASPKTNAMWIGWQARGGDADVNMDCLKEVIDWIGVDKKQIIAVGGVPKYEIEIRAVAPQTNEEPQ